jgi:hypothetical protein
MVFEVLRKNDWTATKETIAEQEKHKNTKMLSAKEIVKGTISLESLPEPYLFLYDTAAGEAHNLARAVNILAKQKGYKVVTHTMDALGVAPHYVCMVKESSGGEKKNV